ncbi:MAG: SGNH/GDSL hydrolase family protein [Nitrospira sp.]|nr:SGNH/GDSL hydrolase family protein [bacterium]MBL7050053.1 SGNH/GDSL hydrolase family protein [Nitrospira sp.]
MHNSQSVFFKALFWFSIIAGILLSPPVFEPVFSMIYLLDSEKLPLWIFSGLLVMSGIYINSVKQKNTAAAFILFNILLLLTIELGTRTGVKLFFPEKESSLARRSNWTYDELRVYQGNPFTQFAGIPSTKIAGGRPLGNLAEFNNFGFVGRDFSYDKPAEVIRIAALGGSTTGNGYPLMMEEYLRKTVPHIGDRIEVMNFGHSYYTTAHTLTNFILNVVDFNPDYIVIHHGWNDWLARAPEDVYRSDYAHYLRSFKSPSIPDRYILRISVLYRALKFLSGTPEWAFLESAIQMQHPLPTRLLNQRELGTFRRNIETIINLANLRNIKVVLTTMPHVSEDHAGHLKYIEALPYIEQFNSVLRTIAKKYDNILFTDLDMLMTGTEDAHFIDVAHLDDEGMLIKARHIGNSLASDLTK